jgi:hypothetical protein
MNDSNVDLPAAVQTIHEQHQRCAIMKVDKQTDQ